MNPRYASTQALFQALTLPLLQAPMAGTATPELAAAVSNAGALGGLGLGAATPAAAHAAILRTQALTARPFQVNLFCHAAPARDSEAESRWIERARPLFETFGSTPPPALEEIYRPFQLDPAMLEVLLETRPAVVSFHFGLPTPAQIEALRRAGCLLLATATSLDEGRRIAASGLDAIIAQGWSAGGHRGIFDPEGNDEGLSTEALTRRLVAEFEPPIIAAGGLMDGVDIARALSWGASAAQLGTAFIGCPESAADPAYRERLAAGGKTVMTRAISGRPARCLENGFTAWARDAQADEVPAYPCAYDLGKALNAAAKASGDGTYGAQWAGTGADRARMLPAAALIETIDAEWRQASRG
ncbi:nitronate monooxygenase [Salinicola sp. JS01]|uniref:NAD(P)H-dependent flavin oxidoreductase n=1 Tax=Salinicola sp. JS01 TaxID=3050071 RepID=UPI00255B9DA1|nr:nitronate monooxygenase [Salinicola sp. JS01]WIX31557.1 nitronate monooxygenase [Salinicola sp. JS01]